jgi:transcription elongation GreA/GreB family factor
MNAAPLAWHAAALDDLFVALAERDATAVPRLLDVLRTVPPEPLGEWPPAAAEPWRNGIELALECLDRTALLPFRELLLAFCGIGFDSPGFRDLLATLFRQLAPDYLDPAGLLAALGVRHSDVRTRTIVGRWQVFSVLRPGVLCFHPAHGLGAVEAVDAMANQVRLRCHRLVDLPLDIVLGQMVFVQPSSWLQDVIKGVLPASQAVTADQARERAFDGLVSAAPVSAETLRAILVPAVLSVEELTRLLHGPVVPVPARQPQPMSGQAPAQAPSQSRAWHQARGITEMVGLLAGADTLDDSAVDLANVAAILRAGSERESTARDFAETVSRLQEAFGNGPWLGSILTELAPRALCWNQREIFATEADRIPGRLVTPWFEATATAKGATFLAESTMGLPLRLWSYAERVVAERSGAPALFLDTVVREVARGTPSADVLLWIYRNGGEARQLLASPPLLFRILQRPVRGAYIKSRKELHKLLMDDQDFQRLVMRNGDPDAVLGLVQTVRHTPLLDAGERQSLLVKIVRVFPDAKGLVEERRAPARKAIGKITSVRSFELRRRELEQITQKEIPANARALAHARGYGDLRENAEFKAAKERQAYLSARRSELEDDLHEVRATDFGDVVAETTVVPGCTATLRYADERREQFHVLGLWDSLPEKRHLSYDTPVGRILLGAKIGDTLEMPSGESVQLEAISPLSAELLAWLRHADAE